MEGEDGQVTANGGNTEVIEGQMGVAGKNKQTDGVGTWSGN